MKWFIDLKIAKKLLLSFTCVLLLTAISGIFSIIELGKVNSASTDIATNWLPSIRSLAQIKLMAARMRSNEVQMALFNEDHDAVATMHKRGEGLITDLQSALKTYATEISEPEEKALFPEVEKEVATILTEHLKIDNAVQNQKIDDAKKLFAGDYSTAYFKLLDNLDKLTQVNSNGSDASSQGADHLYASARMWIIGMLIGALIAGFALAMYIARAIATPLTIAVGVAKQVAAGDLTADIRPLSRDETGELMRSLKEMNDSLLGIVTQVRAGTETITTASGEISSGNLDLSSRTEEQASSLEQTASAMEQLTSTVKQNADNARQASQLAISASEVAVAGGTVVSKVVDTMGSIDDSSRKIVDIISVIDGIAFQTNILALNAAVEAARAGEQGRGFAVVASEVRSLAQRSAAAAKEIKILIDNSVAQVGIGSKLVEEAGATMNDVVNSVKRVTDIVGEISSASQEQSAGIEQVNLAITQMDEVTQQNAALVEEAAAASQSMQEQARKLSEVVSVFKLDHRQVVSMANTSTMTRHTVDITPRPHALPD